MSIGSERKREIRAAFREKQGLPPIKPRLKNNPHKNKSRSNDKNRVIIGIDTEGQTDENGNHYCTMISWSDASGKLFKTLRARAGERLTSFQLLRFIVTIPPRYKIFGYSLGYDLTKIIEDLPNESIYKLLRPEARADRDPEDPKKGKKAICWFPFVLNLEGQRLSVSVTGRNEDGTQIFSKRQRTPRIIWDMFRFCAKSFCKKVTIKDGSEKFVGALVDWKVGTKEEWELISQMKAKRSNFTEAQLDEIERYNLLECKLLAELMTRIIAAHDDLCTPSLPYGLHLRRYDGPGSTASAMFKAWGLDEMFAELRKLRAGYPEHLNAAIAGAFFGGRFEHSAIGWREGRSYDINSAYPAQICQLPCILHGRWELTSDENRIRSSTLALVRVSVKRNKGNCKSWAPFPFRDQKGNICYPSQLGATWVWRDEYLTAKESGLWPGIQFLEAWVFQRTCVCPNPFRHFSELYQRRDMVGKDTGEGIVLKLGPNSGYGKLAQSIGRAMFNSWIYAGLITSGTRAQLLAALACHKDPSNLFAVATDGIFSGEELELPPAPITGAEGCKKPLGGWDREADGRLFLIRPGMALGSKVKARGIGEGALKSVADAVVECWEKHHDTSARVIAPTLTRFFGARQSVYFVPARGAYMRSGSYGRWIEREQIVTFNPLPKRQSARADGTLVLRNMSGRESTPYEKGMITPDGEALEQARWEELDQPDPDDGIFDEV